MTTKDPYTIDLNGLDVITFPSLSDSNTSVTWSVPDTTITNTGMYSDDDQSWNIALDNYTDTVTVSDWNWGQNKGIQVDEDADITIGDRSLKDFMNTVEERLAILKPNPALEDRWTELKELRNKYVELEKELLEKELMWEKLKT